MADTALLPEEAQAESQKLRREDCQIDRIATPCVQSPIAAKTKPPNKTSSPTKVDASGIVGSLTSGKDAKISTSVSASVPSPLIKEVQNVGGEADIGQIIVSPRRARISFTGAVLNLDEPSSTNDVEVPGAPARSDAMSPTVSSTYVSPFLPKKSRYSPKRPATVGAFATPGRDPALGKGTLTSPVRYVSDIHRLALTEITEPPLMSSFSSGTVSGTYGSGSISPKRSDRSIRKGGSAKGLLENSAHSTLSSTPGSWHGNRPGSSSGSRYDDLAARKAARSARNFSGGASPRGSSHRTRTGSTSTLGISRDGATSHHEPTSMSSPSVVSSAPIDADPSQGINGRNVGGASSLNLLNRSAFSLDAGDFYDDVGTSNPDFANSNVTGIEVCKELCLSNGRMGNYGY